MSKSPKKAAATASWRTLMRRAKTAPRAEAKAMREQASILRRAERAKAAAKKAPKRMSKTEIKGHLHEAAEMAGSSVSAGSASQAHAIGPNPDHHLRVKARAILVAARKRGGNAEQQVVDALERLLSDAAYEVKAEAEQRKIESLKEIQDSQRVKVVASFMAQIDAMAQANGGKMPKVVPVSGFHLAHLMNTLLKAGYSIDGYNYGKAAGIRQ